MTEIKKIKEYVEEKEAETYAFWDKMYFLDGIDGDDLKMEMAKLFEAIKKELEIMNLKSDSTETVAFPIARRCLIQLKYKIKNVKNYLEYIDNRLCEEKEVILEFYRKEKKIIKISEIKNTFLDSIEFEEARMYYEKHNNNTDWEAHLCWKLAEEVKANRL